MRLTCVSIIKTFLLLTTVLFVSSCGDKEGAHATKTQIVAKVNGDEISIHQVNQQLARLGPLDEEKTKAATKQVLKRLIDLQLLEQKAKESKLDRDPQVLQAIEASRQQMLAQAYVQRKMLKAYVPTSEEIDNFYSAHPELFAQRRVFNLQELAVEDGRDHLQAIEQAVESNTNISAVAEWLKSQGHQFSLNANVRAAEQLPSKLLNELQSRKDGEMLTVVNGNSVNVLSIAASEQQSITKEKAIPVIEKYFENKNKKEEMQLQMKAIKEAATIELVGAFVDMELDDPSEDKTNTKSDKNELVQENHQDAVGSTLDKGLAGF